LNPAATFATPIVKFTVCVRAAQRLQREHRYYLVAISVIVEDFNKKFYACFQLIKFEKINKMSCWVLNLYPDVVASV
jgi:hypothetical protein